jgi:hypothetical protein
MQMTSDSSLRVRSFLLILTAAVIQGVALYGLYRAVDGSHWPASEPRWLFGLYLLAIFIPVTVQLIAEHAHRAQAWVIVGVLSVLFFYFGWHYGSHLTGHSLRRLPELTFPLGFVVLVLWLMMLPFLQWRLAAGYWRPQYTGLFSAAWRNQLMLAEAALFTGVFWLLLLLWQTLFSMLGIDFFKKLFGEAFFTYPVTSLAFGLALYLIGSVERFISVVLEQLLNVLKWLAILAGLLLALFTLTLLFKLPMLILHGKRIVEAAWLLWLIAVVVLLFNAAYRDGSVDKPYPAWIAFALRLVIPLTVVVAFTAIYALWIRIEAHGFTVERVWAAIVAASALAHCLGYAVAAWGGRWFGTRWMAGMSQVNILAALMLIAILILALTPVLSPQRIAADSQYRMALRASSQAANHQASRGVDPLTYLRFDSGQYGLRKLRQLADIEGHPRAEHIRRTARAMLERKDRWSEVLTVDPQNLLADLQVFPAGRTIDAELRARMLADLRRPGYAWVDDGRPVQLAAVHVDLDGDGSEEVALVLDYRAFCYQRTASGWDLAGEMRLRSAQHTWPDGAEIIDRLRQSDVGTQLPRWKDLRVGMHTFQMER